MQVIPESVWRINVDPPADGGVAFDTSASEQWWDQTDQVKLILADNQLKGLSEDISHLPALAVLDVSTKLSFLCCGGGRVENRYMNTRMPGIISRQSL